MLFNDDFIEAIEENPIGGIIDACNLALIKLNELSTNENWNDAEHELLWEAATFIDLIIKSSKLDFDSALPEVSGEIDSNCSDLKSYIDSVLDKFGTNSLKIKIDSYRNRYQSALKSSFAYEFSEGDFDRVQLLINELRNHINENEHIEVDHKRRLLKRLEKLQSELHKRVSDLDNFWGLVGDAGVVLGKLGKDAKPIVDRIREITEIVWKTQVTTEKLPIGSPIIMLDKDPQ